MHDGEHTGEYLWLRQTVTITANGQMRTLEMAIPVRLGATPEEIGALRAQATDGMAQLSQALDDAVATAFAGAAPSQPASPGSAVKAPMPAASASPAPSASTSAATNTALSPSGEARDGATAAPALRESSASASSPLSRPSESPARDAASAAPTVPAPKAPAASAPTTPSRPASNPTNPEAPAASPSGRAPTPISSAPMNRQEFLSAASQLGLNPKQAMERLGVRSLEGLNLREALEALRRQTLRGDDGDGSVQSPAPASATPSAPHGGTAPSNTSRSQPSPSARLATGQSNSPGNARTAGGSSSAPSRPTPSPAPAATHFDEEIDAEFEYSISDEGFRDEFGEDIEDGQDAGYPSQAAAADGLDDLTEFDDEDDVPDFSAGASHASAPPPRQTPPASRGAASTRAAATPASPAPRPTVTNTHNGATGEATGASAITQLRAVELIKRMRNASAGGNTSEHQWKAYRNIVLGELTDAEARMLVQGLWRVPPEKLGADQLDELISWGKRDDFADDARLVLAELAAERKAERERATGAASGTDAPTNGRAASASPAAPASPRSHSRTTKREGDESAGS